MNRRGRLVAGALACALAASTLATTSGTASNHRAIPPGEWEGIIAFFGDTGTASGQFEGSFELRAAGGNASGGFGWEGVVATNVGDVLVTIVGEISGDTTSPLLSITGGTSAGIPIPDPTGTGNLVLTNVSCNSIEGVGANFTTAAQISDSEWFAVRAGAAIAGGTFFADLRALRLEAIELVGLVGDRDISVLNAQLVRLTAEADRLLAQVDRTPECQAHHFRSLIASSVERLLRVVLENPDIATAGEFMRLVVLSLSAGTWGPSATDPDALDLEVAILEDFVRRVDEAIAEGDEVSLVSLAALATLLGFSDIEARINEALAGLGP